MVSELKGLSESEVKTLNRREGQLDILLRSGKSIDYVKTLNYKEYNKLMGTHVGEKIEKMNLSRKEKDSRIQKSLAGQHRLLEQLNQNVKQVVNYHLEKRNISDQLYQEFIQSRARELLQKEGQYGIAEVNIKGYDPFWIKFRNQKQFQKHLDSIKNQYGDTYKIVFYDFNLEQKFVQKKYNAVIEKAGITI